MSIRNAADFGKLIKEMRKAAKVTQKDLAAACWTGISIGKRYGVNHHNSFSLLKPEVHSPALSHDSGHYSPNPKVI